MIDLDKLLELESKASPQWELKSWYTTDLVCVKSSDDAVNMICEPQDGRLIFEIRNSIRELCLELKAARKVVEAARYASREINGHYLGQGPHDENLWYARDQIDLALRELDGENG